MGIFSKIFGPTSIHEAAKSGTLPELYKNVSEFIRRGVDVNEKDNEGKTPLHWAIRACHLELVKLLIDHGADVNATDDKGRTPLHINPVWKEEVGLLFSFMSQERVARVLLEKGADANKRDINGRTPLHEAAREGHEEVARLLLKDMRETQEPSPVLQKVDVNAKDGNGIAPLHEAAFNGMWLMVDVLIQNGADVNATSHSGNTPLHMAMRKEGELWNDPTLLHLATWSGNHPNMVFDVTNEYVVKSLLKSGANRNARNNNGQTPLNLAKRKDLQEIAHIISSS